MSNNIQIILSVDDKGDLKAVAHDANKAKKSLDGVAKGAGTADRRLKGASQQSSNTSKNFSKMAQGVNGGLVPAYAELAATAFAVTAVFAVLKNAADFRVVEESQRAFTGATGIGMRSLTKDIQTASDSMLNFQAASEAASIGAASGLASGDITKLAKGAANVSKILGRDVTDSFNRLIRGVTKAEPELLDELGIILRLETAKKNYAAQIGKTAKALTNFEQKQAVLNEVQTQLDEKFNNVAESIDIQGNALNKLAVAFDEVLKPIKRVTAFLVEPVALFFAKNIGALAIAMTLLAVPIIKRVIPALDSFSESAKKNASKAKRAFVSSRKELKSLSKDAANLKINPMAAVQKATKGIKSTSAGFSALQKGDQLTKKQADMMLMYAKNNVGAVKRMSVEQKRIYMRELQIMAGGKKAWVAKVQKEMHSLNVRWKATTQAMVVTWRSAMAKMQGAFSKFAKGIDKLSRAMGIIGVAMMLASLAKEAAAVFVKANEDVEKYTEKVESLTSALSDVNDEYSTFAKQQEGGLSSTPFNKTTLASLKAIGQMVGSVVPKVAKLQELLNNPVTGSMPTLGKYTEAEARLLAEANKKFKEAGNAVGQYNAVMKFYAENKEEIGDSFGGDNMGLLRTLKDGEPGMGLIEGFLTDEANFEEAGKQMAKTLGTLEMGLKATRMGSTEAGKEMLAMIVAMKAGKKVDLEQFNALGKAIGLIGDKAASAKEQGMAISNQYSTMITGMTSYASKYSSLMNTMLDQQTTLTQLEKEGNLDAAESLSILEGKLAIVQEFHRLEYDLAYKTKKLETDYLSSTKYSTTGQKTLVSRQRDLKVFELQIANANAKLANLTAAGVVQDPEAIAAANLEIQLLQNKRAALNDLNNDLLQINLAAKQSFETGLTSAFEGLITGTMKVKDAFKNMATGILQSIAKILANRMVSMLINGLFDGGTLNTTSTSSTVINPKGRYGGVFDSSGKVPGYAVGGIAKGPQAGYPVELHGTEAVVPLPNGKSIPVQMSGSNSSNNVVVNVSVDKDGNSQSSTESQSSQDAGQLGQMIAQAVQKELHNQKRSGGILNPYGAA